jgi:hypothetical protein
VIAINAKGIPPAQTISPVEIAGNYQRTKEDIKALVASIV